MRLAKIELSFLAVSLLVCCGSAVAQTFPSDLPKSIAPLAPEFRPGQTMMRLDLDPLKTTNVWVKLPAWACGGWDIQSQKTPYRFDYTTGKKIRNPESKSNQTVPSLTDAQQRIRLRFAGQVDSSNNVWRFEGVPVFFEIDHGDGKEELRKIKTRSINPDRSMGLTEREEIMQILVDSKSRIILKSTTAHVLATYKLSRENLHCKRFERRFDFDGKLIEDSLIETDYKKADNQKIDNMPPGDPFRTGGMAKLFDQFIHGKSSR